MSHATFKELLKMTPEDLRREATQQRELVTKMRLGIEVGKEKDSARFRREKRHLATMLTALHRNADPSLPSKGPKRTV